MIYLIDQIKQKNNGTFMLVDAADVGYGDGSVADVLENVEGLEFATDEEVEEMLTEVFGE